MTIRPPIVRMTTGLSAKCTSDDPGSILPRISNPALQNAETEWKSAAYRPSAHPKRGTNWVASSTIPVNSIINVPIAILFTRRSTPDRRSVPVDCMMSFLDCREIFLLMNIAKSVIMVMQPSPPICIRSIMTVWPKIVQWVKVSNTTRPVTQVALTVVKSASTRSVE